MITTAFIGSKDNELLNFYYETFTAWRRERFPDDAQPVIIDNWQEQGSIRSVLNESDPAVLLSFVPMSSTDLCCKQLQRSNKTLFFAPPLDTSIQAKKDLRKRCKKDRLSVGTLWPFRFSSGLAKLKEITESFALGNLREIEITLADIDSRLLSGRDAEQNSGGKAGFKVRTVMHLLDCAHWLLPSETEQNISGISITGHNDHEITISWQTERAEPISLTLSQKKSEGSALSVKVSGECGQVRYDTPVSLTSDGRGKVIRRISDNLSQRKNPSPIATPAERPLYNCFNLMQVSMHDNICFDCFFRPAADVVYESTYQILACLSHEK